MKATSGVSSLLDGAILAMTSGNLTAVERICLQVIDADPNVAQAHVMLGIVAQRTGRQTEAIRRLTRAHELQPGSFEAAACLAAAYRISGSTQKAIQFAELAAKLKPTDAMAQSDLGSIYLEASRLHDAEGPLRRAVSLSGGGFHFQIALNQCLNLAGKRKEANEVLRQALQTRPFTPEELLNFAALLVTKSNPHGAVEASREAVRRAPKLLRARGQLARALVEAGRGDEAATVLDDPALSECLRADASDSETLTVLGGAYQSLGRVEEARELLCRAIRAPNPVGMAFYAYTHSSRMSEDNGAIIQAIEARLGKATQFDDLPSMHFALGKAYEDLGNYGQAMAHYDEANQCQASGEAVLAPPPTGVTADQANSLFSDEFIQANSGFGSPSDLPIVVVGMIRSGTTLAEQILSSHPYVGGEGEVPFWAYNATELLDIEQGRLRPERVRDAAERYLSLLSAAHPGKQRVVDKMPANYQYLGIMHLALPNARIIHMRRHPVDTCLSIYSTHRREQSEFGSKKGDLVNAYRQYQSIMAHWRAVLPAEQFLDIDYEDLVANSESATKRMLEFCGLEWDETCLHPETNPRAVATPSLWQVRRPINSSSVERWRRFEPWLGDFKELI